jgi:leucyl aminopeptidase (aminopeptidase T)
MKQVLMARGARTLARVCAQVKPGEKVLVVTEPEMVPIAEAVAAAAHAEGGEVVTMVCEPRRAHGQEPPVAAAAAMRASDVIFTPVRTSITHTRAVKEAVAAGARAVVLTAFTEEMLMEGGIEADFAAIAPTCRAVAEAFTRGTAVRVTAPGGTDLALDITARRGNALTCIVGAGEFSPVPDVEANVCPVEGSATGVIVADASIPYLGIGVLREPVRLTVERGMVVKVEGGEQAERLRVNWESYRDPTVYNVAELGLGLNPKGRMCGIMLEDEAVLGAAHIGIGTSITLGGTVKAPCHYDVLFWKPTIAVDGQVIVREGQVSL